MAEALLSKERTLDRTALSRFFIALTQLPELVPVSQEVIEAKRKSEIAHLAELAMTAEDWRQYDEMMRAFVSRNVEQREQATAVVGRVQTMLEDKSRYIDCKGCAVLSEHGPLVARRVRDDLLPRASGVMNIGERTYFNDPNAPVELVTGDHIDISTVYLTGPQTCSEAGRPAAPYDYALLIVGLDQMRTGSVAAQELPMA